ncbi:unnamed protein product [Penicillium camemberti]|uniref:Str. FM013 n=1 Tax=Penicillium camemberti (strain FM 013) TaxID=1429867 RepID=A0A0G4PJS6_PENC3|nr:unnamed protein product [Penicillium camemberti]
MAVKLQYHAQPIISSYITKIVPGTPEADVDHLWSNLLAYYLPGTQNFGVEREAYIQSRSRTRANVCVSTLVRGSMSKVIMVENKRASRSQSGSPASSSWTHAKDQLLGYMLARRAEQTENLPRQFGIVDIGRIMEMVPPTS